MRAHFLGAVIASVAAFASPVLADAPKPRDVIVHYADLAEVMYGSSAATAKDMQKAIDAFLAAPSADSLGKARDAWKAARVYYQQTEAFRFGNKIVDEWEGNVNAWPLDEGLIDYVDKKSYGEKSDENPLYTANVIASKSIRIGKKTVDVTKITPKLLHELNSAGGVEANVGSGWHAIEFLLWGQNLHNATPSQGQRPYTDYDLKNCTNGNCDRRGEYLKVATQTLVADLDEMTGLWGAKGKARAALIKKNDKAGLATIFTGLGSLSYGELAGERMKLGLILHDPEEAHDCFSNNTQNAHYYDEVGIRDVYYGTFVKPDGSKVTGPSVADLIRAADPKIADEIDAKSAAALAALKALKDVADSGEITYDKMLEEGNTKGAKLIQDGVDALVAQAHAIERGVSALKLQIKMEGSKSLDDPKNVKKK
ncbi:MULTISPECIES: imelysin family protein [Xanthobacter]|uniref:Imelysin family protein n=1 Tax=Xanthobacter aminoxidans TaxID=186280 RepID=A0ABW6ZFY4_9HYPH|nr:imelysin family protein [Xanthobacter sp. 91]